MLFTSSLDAPPLETRLVGGFRSSSTQAQTGSSFAGLDDGVKSLLMILLFCFLGILMHFNNCHAQQWIDADADAATDASGWGG